MPSERNNTQKIISQNICSGCLCSWYSTQAEKAKAKAEAPKISLAEETLGLNARLEWQMTDQKGLDDIKLFTVYTWTSTYSEIEKLFHKTLPNNIYSIQRIENGYQQEQFSVQAAAIKAKYGASFDRAKMQKFLFHETQAVEAIINNATSGFQPLLSGTANAAIFGDGTYFARDAA